MKELLEIRINYDYASMLFKVDEGRDIGTTVKVVQLPKEDSRYYQIPIIDQQVKKQYDRSFFFGWQIKRRYSEKELDSALLLHIKIETTFEPSGEECGTIYDESAICEICGVGRKQLGLLRLKQGSIPKKDIARTIAGEIIVSEKFTDSFKRRGLKGGAFEPVLLNTTTSNYCQPVVTATLNLSQNTVAGINPFDLSTSNLGEVYKCPKGHTIGLNLLSEPHILNTNSINDFDFFVSKQKIGVNRGLLRPEPLYFCSQKFRKMVQEEELKGFKFEIAHIE